MSGEATLGRGSECEVVIPARSLSRKHATVLVEGGTHFIQDLGSRNKTYRGTVSMLFSFTVRSYGEGRGTHPLSYFQMQYILCTY